MDGKGTFWVKTTTAKWLLDIFQVKKNAWIPCFRTPVKHQITKDVDVKMWLELTQ